MWLLPARADYGCYSPSLKQLEDFKIIGKSMNRLDTPEKTSGKTIFGIDVKVADMLTALVARPPVFGSKVKRRKKGT